MNNYTQTLEYLFCRLPMFQRIGASAYKNNLDNTINLLEALGNPQDSFRSLHIGGTNGKGSTSHLLASILKEKGLRVGLHTSPHLVDFRERIRVDGMMCEERYVVDFVEQHKDLIERIEPSFFELSVAMAFKYFEQSDVDIAVIEVGMGGRLDSTNVISPLLCVITNISYDHTQFLGDTLAKIAVEKAGIIKPNTPVIIGQTQEETKEVFIKRTEACKSKIYFADEHLSVDNVREGENMVLDVLNDGQMCFRDLTIPLCGDYQRKNILSVLAAISELNHQDFDIDEGILRSGIMNLQTNAPLCGRWQKLSDKPLTICDTGHNEDGLRVITEQLKRLDYERLHIVFGVVNDKDLTHILPLLPKDAYYYLCKADIPRALDADCLAEKFKANGDFCSYRTYPSVHAAFEAACRKAIEKDVVFVGGSTFTVAEVLSNNNKLK